MRNEINMTVDDNVIEGDQDNDFMAAVIDINNRESDFPTLQKKGKSPLFET